MPWTYNIGLWLQQKESAKKIYIKMSFKITGNDLERQGN